MKVKARTRMKNRMKVAADSRTEGETRLRKTTGGYKDKECHIAVFYSS